MHIIYIALPILEALICTTQRKTKSIAAADKNNVFLPG